MLPNLPGTVFQKDNNTCYCAIKNFSPELKTLIKNQLAAVWNGFPQVEETPEIHSYKRTLASFLDRYSGKSDETKKGMIGELLSHILIGYYFDDLSSLSVLKNKEERSIKKGFDIIYYEIKKDAVWYAEVKSGNRGKNAETSDDYNTELLNRSHKDLSEKFIDNRDSLWETALIDVTLTINDSKKKIKLQRLLDRDSPVHKQKAKKNAVLVSVLYHCPGTEPVDIKTIKAFHLKVRGDKIYQDEIVFSIQKKTFQKVSDFLEYEAQS